MVKEYDYIVIGGGSGGVASANRAAMLLRLFSLKEKRSVVPVLMWVVYLKRSCGMVLRLLRPFTVTQESMVLM